MGLVTRTAGRASGNSSDHEISFLLASPFTMRATSNMGRPAEAGFFGFALGGFAKAANIRGSNEIDKPG
jgi:hypothetical protein